MSYLSLKTLPLTDTVQI